MYLENSENQFYLESVLNNSECIVLLKKNEDKSVPQTNFLVPQTLVRSGHSFVGVQCRAGHAS